MEIQNIFANRIDTAGNMISYDESCKKVLANKYILAWILKSCVQEYEDCSIKDITEKYIEGNPEISKTAVHVDESAEFITGTNTEDASINEGVTTFDIKFMSLLPEGSKEIDMIINVESQNDFYPGYPIVKRGIYYTSRMISGQYGTVFVKSEYDKIKKVVSIWICTDPPNYRKNTITDYHIQEESIIGDVKEKASNYDLMKVVMVCLGDDKESNGLLKMLNVLLSGSMQPADKKKILKDEFDIPMTKELKEGVDDMCNLSIGVFKEGMDEATLNNIKSLMTKKGWDIEECMDILDIPEERWDTYKDKLANELQPV